MLTPKMRQVLATIRDGQPVGGCTRMLLWLRSRGYLGWDYDLEEYIITGKGLAEVPPCQEGSDT